MIPSVNANIHEIKADYNNKNRFNSQGTQSIQDEKKEIFHDNLIVGQQIFNINNIEDFYDQD